MAKASKPSAKRPVRCYLCGHQFEVSARTMSTACGRCNKAIIIEDVVVKSYVPVNDLQTCGKIRIMKRGRVAAKRIQSGDGIVCEGFMEGAIVTDGDVELGPKATWKGKSLQSRALAVADGAKLMGVISVPWARPGSKPPRGNGASAKRSSTTPAKRNGSTPTAKRSGEATTPKHSAPATSAQAAGSTATVKRAGTATAAKRSNTAGSTKLTASATRTKTATTATSSKRTASKKTTKRPATKKKTTVKRVVKKAATKRAAAKKKTTKKTTAKKTTAKKTTAKKTAAKKKTKKKTTKKKTTRRR